MSPPERLAALGTATVAEAASVTRILRRGFIHLRPACDLRDRRGRCGVHPEITWPFIVLPQAEVEAALATPGRVRHGNTI